MRAVAARQPTGFQGPACRATYLLSVMASRHRRTPVDFLFQPSLRTSGNFAGSSDQARQGNLGTVCTARKRPYNTLLQTITVPRTGILSHSVARGVTSFLCEVARAIYTCRKLPSTCPGDDLSTKANSSPFKPP